MISAMRRSFVVLHVASLFFFAPQSPASSPGDDIFASGFEYRDFPAVPIVDAGAPAAAPTLFGAT